MRSADTNYTTVNPETENLLEKGRFKQMMKETDKKVEKATMNQSLHLPPRTQTRQTINPET